MVMTRIRGIGRGGGLIVLGLALAAPGADAQERTGPPLPDRRLSLEAAAGPQVSYVGSTFSAAFGFAPVRRLTLLASVERSHIRDEINQYADGYSFERGGTEVFVSGELRYTFLADRRVSPYVVGGAGRGISRPSVNQFFPRPNERHIQVLFYGAGVRMPLGQRFDLFADARFLLAVEASSDFLGVRFPVRGGIAWRF